MSKNNCVVILHTKNQYRVNICSSIENLNWSYIENSFVNYLVPTRILEYFKTCEGATYSFERAWKIAEQMFQRNDIEYGIIPVNTSKSWSDIVEWARYYAKEELKKIDKDDVLTRMTLENML